MGSAPRSPNGFLSALPADDFELIRPHLRTVDLASELALVEADETLKRAYLPHRGAISLVVRLARGEHVQVAMIGRHSIFGSFSALGDPTALTSAVVLVPGVASTLEVDRLRAAADQSATFRAALLRHGLAICAQIQQTAGCNAAHTVESRLARCLLQTYDLSGSDKLVLTQESLAQMIGARRNSVSLVATTLQQANFIPYSRTHRDRRSGWPQQDRLRMLRSGEGPVRQIAPPSPPAVSIRARPADRRLKRDRIRAPTPPQRLNVRTPRRGCDTRPRFRLNRPISASGTASSVRN